MPNAVARTGNNFPNGVFVPEVWSKKLNDKFYSQCFLMDIANSDWEGEIAGQGSSVIIRNRPTVAISKYTVGKAISYQDVVDEQIKLLIDQANIFAIQLDDIDKAQQDIDSLDELTKDASYQMKIAIEQQVLGSIYANAANTVTQVALTKDIVLKWIIDAEVALQKANTPVQDRWILIPPEVGAYLQLSDLKNVYMTGDSKTILRDEMTNDRIGKVGGLNVYVTNNLTTTTGGVVHCIAGHKSALTFASQVEKLQTLILQDTFASAIRGMNVFGFKTLNTKGLVHLPITLT